MGKRKTEKLDNTEAIKRLMILSLVRSGLSSEDIGKTLGVTGRTIRNMIPVKEIKNKAKKKR